MNRKLPTVYHKPFAACKKSARKTDPRTLVWLTYIEIPDFLADFLRRGNEFSLICNCVHCEGKSFDFLHPVERLCPAGALIVTFSSPGGKEQILHLSAFLYRRRALTVRIICLFLLYLILLFHASILFTHILFDRQSTEGCIQSIVNHELF